MVGKLEAIQAGVEEIISDFLQADLRTESSRCSRNASTITTISKSHVWRFKNGMVRHETRCVRVLIERPLGFLFPQFHVIPAT
jgi:hypothetical protein